VLCSADCSQCAMAVTVLCGHFVPYVMMSAVDPFYLASITIVCCGYYLSPWWSLLLAVNPLRCTVIVGVCVVHCLLCTVEVIGFCCGPSNWHHGSVYYFSVEPCTLVIIYDCVDPLPGSMAVTIVCCGPFTVCLGGLWHLWCTLLLCIVVVIGVCF